MSRKRNVETITEVKPRRRHEHPIRRKFKQILFGLTFAFVALCVAFAFGGFKVGLLVIAALAVAVAVMVYKAVRAAERVVTEVKDEVEEVAHEAAVAVTEVMNELGTALHEATGHHPAGAHSTDHPEE